MVGPRVYHLKHARSYPAFTQADPAKIMDLAVKWLGRHDFRVKRKGGQYSRGIMLFNFISILILFKFKIIFECNLNLLY